MTKEDAIKILSETEVKPNIHPDSMNEWYEAMEMAIDAIKKHKGGATESGQ